MNRIILTKGLLLAALLASASANADEATRGNDAAPVDTIVQTQAPEATQLSWGQKVKLRFQINSCRDAAGETSGSDRVTLGGARPSNQIHAGAAIKGDTSLANTSWGRERRQREAAERAQGSPASSMTEGEDASLSRMSPRCRELIRDYGYLVASPKRR